MALTLDRSQLKKKKEPVDTEFVALSNPPDALSDSQEQIEEIENRFRRRAIKLDDDVARELSDKLYWELRDWKDSRTSLKTKLREWNDLYEGVVTVTDFPWPGSSQLHVPIPKIKAREIKSTINRNTMRPTPFLMCKYSGPDSLYAYGKDMVSELEDFVEDKIKNGTNVHQTLKDAIIPTIRDGTCPVQVIWETELERVTDYKIYESVSDFTTDYPDADAAGVSTKAYANILSQLNHNKRYEIQYEYDIAVYDGPKAYIVPLVDFVHWPVFETELANTITHGKRIWYKDYEIEKFEQIGKFTNKEAVEKVLASPSEVRDDESVTVSRDAIEGISRQINKQAKGNREYECYELVHKADLDKDGVKEKYLIYFHYLTRSILRIEKYPIRKGALTYFPLRLLKRDNRFLGISLIDDIADLSLEIDILHRMRINSRTITHVPTFKAKIAAKDKFDPSRPQFRFAPGATFWLTDVNDVEQFDIKPVDLAGSIEEENFLFQIVNLVTGSDSGMSGQSNPLDPRAPARKQQELLRQSTNRIDDYVEALLGPFAQIGQFIIDLHYQYGPDRVKYYVTSEDGSKIQKEIERSKLYNPNVMFVVNGTSVFMNPEAEFDRMQQVAQILSTNPASAQDPNVQMEMLARLLDASRVKDYKNLLPNKGVVQQVTAGTGGVIPTEIDKQREMKLAIQKQKAADRLTETMVKQKHAIHAQVLDSAMSSKSDQDQAVLDASLEAAMPEEEARAA